MKNTLLTIVALICISFSYNCQAQEEGQRLLTPKKVEIDTNFDGKVDRVEVFDDNGQILRVELDTSGDGKIDEWITYENGQPLKGKKDTNSNGKPDVWIEY